MALPNPGWHLRDANLRRQPQRGRAPIPPSVVVPHRLEVNRWWKVSGPFELPASWDCGTTQKNVPLTAMDKVLSEYDCPLHFLLSIHPMKPSSEVNSWCYHLIPFSISISQIGKMSNCMSPTFYLNNHFHGLHPPSAHCVWNAGHPMTKVLITPSTPTM